MKINYAPSTALAALIPYLVNPAEASKDETTFAVLRFTNKALTRGRMDPIVSPGVASQHVHNIMGGSGFSSNATAEDLDSSRCSNAMVRGDNSAYWFPSLYFHDGDAGTFESVEVDYVNVYYFFEQSDDDITAFPKGLRMVAGDPNTRTAPGSSATNLNPDSGDIVNVKWTCPRLNGNYDPPSWPADSDGTTAGIGDPVNKGEGVGFPDVNCDGLYSPLRADVHFPSCYDPSAGLAAYETNMGWPTTDPSTGKVNCPDGWVHTPHLFFEVYWSTADFADRWTPGQGTQPFVLSNGDATGFSSHADFFAAWDEDLLQHIIDTCDAGTSGMDTCPGLDGLNTESCTVESDVDEQVDGTLSRLPGGMKISGWSYGASDLPSSSPAASAAASSAAAAVSSPAEPDAVLAAASSSSSTAAAVINAAQEQGSSPTEEASTRKLATTTVKVSITSEAAAAATAAVPVVDSDSPPADVVVETVWVTETVTTEVYAVATDVPERRSAKFRRGHFHRHHHGSH
ncbi:protein of unknown function (DUF1996) [Geosmithia morbida]|uniref:DUF1996 domain-containing protein n=1 Tax=Geosmithia morbida TaxID=1094350 RepID=A0A9P4YYY2_9HYPO|nr:protein of unknown function (DUF1996) [Geosmithia morbida]KAF4124228.1 protein of unknown function (DUF1996) [Geosmithia morbida]